MLSGYIGSGKDTVGEYLVNRHGFVRCAFADILKDEVAKMYNIDRNLMDSQSGKETTVQIVGDDNKVVETSVRRILIDRGNFRRNQDINYWVDMIVAHIRSEIKKDNSKNFVVTDWRYPNEYERIVELVTDTSVVTWRINRRQSSRLNDVSETSLMDFHFDEQIDNYDTVQSLERCVKTKIT